MRLDDFSSKLNAGNPIKSGEFPTSAGILFRKLSVGNSASAQKPDRLLASLSGLIVFPSVDNKIPGCPAETSAQRKREERSASA
jgi:hypothetical protein